MTVRICLRPCRNIKSKSRRTHFTDSIELAQSGEMKGKPVILIDREAIEREMNSGLEMI